ncbi:hypothetical protein [Amycolatopsis sp.]|uniref:hypothetical protein n=1 Tax=Amycolatopsis sp. TaxID=37632 RepID=UPI002D7ED42C|nr:hypothetical protein [Amycolatopsis sp.]HET6704311.1 hypothetical protein [Amycolatopsis sp.]
MDYLAVIRDAQPQPQPQLELWRQRQVRNPPEEPERGSDLAGDDKVFAYQRISEMVRITHHLVHRIGEARG